MIRIDSHQHFWNINSDEYAWIDADRASIRRDFLPRDLGPLLHTNGIAGCIAVHARQMVKETPWLLALADEYDWIRGVVGWAPLLVDAGEPYLAMYAPHPKLVGIRHVIQDTPVNECIHSDRFNDGIRQLERYGLVFDLLIHGRQLSEAIAFVDRHPNQVFVLDHVAKPCISSREFDEEWATGIVQLALRPHVYCKLSGMLTEVVDPVWSVNTLRRTFDTVLESFGASRLMYGSDWPVCLLRAGYEDWVNAVQEMIAPLSLSEQCAIWGENTEHAYGLDTRVRDSTSRVASAALAN